MNGTRGWSPAPLPRAPLPVTSAEKGPRYTPDSPVGAPRLLSRPTWSPGSESSPPTNQPTHRAVRVAGRVVRFVEVRATTDRVRVRDAGRRDGSARSRTACRRRNAWALRHAGEDQQRFKVDEVFQAGAILLGRVTYEIFAAFWPTAPKDHGSPIGARALTQAADRDVVVTRTVRDMATGTDLAFGSLGSVSLRRVPGEWELFNVSVG